MRTGPVARVMPKPSNQARTAGVDFRVRIDRVRTGSIAVSSSLSWAPKAIRPKSRFSSVSRRAEQRGDLVHQFLVIALHSAILAPFQTYV